MLQYFGGSAGGLQDFNARGVDEVVHDLDHALLDVDLAALLRAGRALETAVLGEVRNLIFELADRFLDLDQARL